MPFALGYAARVTFDHLANRSAIDLGGMLSVAAGGVGALFAADVFARCGVPALESFALAYHSDAGQPLDSELPC